MKTGSREKTLGGREATTGGVESKKRDKGGREKETGGGTEEASGGGKTSKGEGREADEGRKGTVEAKRDGRCLPSGSGSTGSSYAGVAKELVEESKSGTIGISSI